MFNRPFVPILLLLLLLVVALAGCGFFGTGSATLKVQSATVDSLVLAGEAFLLIGDSANALCPKGLMPLEACHGFRFYAEGHEPKNDVCKAPTITALPAVLDKCGHKVAYPMAVQAYRDNKNNLVAVASAAEAMIRQVAGFASSVNKAKGN